MTTDLRTLLLEACALGEEATRVPEADNERHVEIRARLDEIDAIARTLASADAAPGVMTVAAALMLPEVRSGATWWRLTGIGATWRLVADSDGTHARLWRRVDGGEWCASAQGISIPFAMLWATCTLADPTPSRETLKGGER